MVKLFSFATSATKREYHVSFSNMVDRGRAAPSARVSSGLIILSGSIFNRVPIPEQVGQAPCGELKENDLGSISGKLKLSIGQAKRSE